MGDLEPQWSGLCDQDVGKQEAQSPLTLPDPLFFTQCKSRPVGRWQVSLHAWEWSRPKTRVDLEPKRQILSLV